MGNKMHLERFGALVEEIASHVMDVTHGTPGWQAAILDVRYPAETAMHGVKLRIRRANSVMESQKVPDEVDLLLEDVWEIKDLAFPEKWYGLKLEITPTGDCQVEFNYDANCLDDFLDS